MNKPVKLSAVSDLLESVGFILTVVKGSHRLFTHGPTGTTLLLPLRARELRPSFVKVVSRTLDENGIMDRDGVETRLWGDGCDRRGRQVPPAHARANGSRRRGSAA